MDFIDKISNNTMSTVSNKDLNQEELTKFQF